MKVIISCCLFAFLLSCNLTAAIIHKIVEQKKSFNLPCPHPVDKVKWSREKNGKKTDLMTVEGEKETKHISDPYKYYSSLADKSLRIRRVMFSDDGRYLCNDEAAVDLTVIPPGTVVHEAAERTSVTLKCPDVLDDHGWWTDVVDIQQQRRFVVSKAEKTLTIKRVNAADSGLYYCSGKPAAYLNVIRDDASDRGNEAEPTKPPTRQTVAMTTVPLTTRANSNMATTKKGKSNNESTEDEDNKGKTTPVTFSATTTSTDEASASSPAASAAHSPRVRLGIVILYLVIMISITVTTWRKGEQSLFTSESVQHFCSIKSTNQSLLSNSN
ncbi:uncharacterized protein [Labrus bergylta]|uniref:uncharacterized protein isoform X3 n=1 Tax=Labrus bergylta TaxID=56723 RepID=UPI00331336FF